MIHEINMLVKALIKNEKKYQKGMEQEKNKVRELRKVIKV